MDDLDELIDQLQGKSPRRREPEREPEPEVPLDDLIDQLQGKPDRFKRLEEARQTKYAQGGGGALDVALRGVAPFASVAHRIVNDDKEREAVARFNAGTANDRDMLTVARMESRQKADQEGGVGRTIGQGLANIPAIVGEATLTGGLAAPIRAGRFAGAIAPELAAGGARLAVQTAAMPSMYLESAQQKALETGGSIADPKNLVPAFAHGAIQTAILGRGGKGGAKATVLGEQAAAAISGREAAKTVGRYVGSFAGREVAGLAESEVAEAVARNLDLSTKYGTLTELYKSGGENWKEAIAHAVTFGVFAGMHTPGDARQLKQTRQASINESLENFRLETAKLAAQGWSKERIGEQLKTDFSKLAEAAQNPPESSVHDRDYQRSYSARISGWKQLFLAEGMSEDAAQRQADRYGMQPEIYGTPSRPKGRLPGDIQKPQEAAQKPAEPVPAPTTEPAPTPEKVPSPEPRAGEIVDPAQRPAVETAPQLAPAVEARPEPPVIEATPQKSVADLKAASEAAPEETPEQYRAKLETKIRSQGRDPELVKRLVKQSGAESAEEFEAFMAEQGGKLSTTEMRLARELAEYQGEQANIAAEASRAEIEAAQQATRLAKQARGEEPIAPAPPPFLAPETSKEPLVTEADRALAERYRKPKKPTQTEAPPAPEPPAPEVPAVNPVRAIYDRVRADRQAELPYEPLVQEIDAAMTGKSKKELVEIATAMEIVGTQTRSKEWIAKAVKQKILDMRAGAQRQKMVEEVETPTESELPPAPTPADPNRMGIVPPGFDLPGRALEAVMPRRPAEKPDLAFDADSPAPRLAPYEDLKVIASTPQGVGKVPGVGVWGPLKDFRATAHEPVDQAIAAHAWTTNFAESEGARVGSRFEKFRDGLGIKNGRLILADGREALMADTFEAELKTPGSQPLTPGQRAFLNEYQKLRESWAERLGEEGVKGADELTAEYFPRPAIGKDGVDQGADRWHTGMRERLYASERAGIDKGIIYDPDPISRIVKTHAGVYKKIADHRLSSDKSLEGKTPKERYEALEAEQAAMLATLDEGAQAELRQTLRDKADMVHFGEGRVDARGGLGGQIFPAEVAKKLQSHFSRNTWTPLEAASNVSQVAKASMLTLDMAAPFTQGLAMMASNPVRWGKATHEAYRSLLDPNRMAKYLERPENAEAAREWIQAGGTLGNLQDFMAGTRKGALLTRIPYLGKVVEATGRAHGTFLDAAKLELWKAHRDVTPPNQRAAAVEAIESSLFMGRMENTGMHPARAMAERMLAFAPSYYRGAANLLATATQRGVSGKIARRALGSYAAGVALTSLAGMVAAASLGWMEWEDIPKRFNPMRGKFLKVPVRVGERKVEVGFGNILTSIMRLMGETVEFYQSDNPIDTGSEGNPIVRFLRGKSALYPSLAADLVTGHDYMGERLPPQKALVQKFTPILLQQLSGDAEPGQKAGDAVASFFGLQSYPQSEADERRTLISKTAQTMFQKNYADLTFPEQFKVMRTVEASDVPRSPLTPQQLERAFAEQTARQQRLTKLLGKDSRSKLESLGKTLPGYNRSIETNGVTVPLTDAQTELFEKLLGEEYEKVIATWKPANLKAASKERREKFLTESLKQAKERAKSRLIAASRNAPAKAPQLSPR